MTPIRETWTSADRQHRILWGDCLEILPTLDTSEVAAVLADPPYGLGDKWNGDGWKTDFGRLWDKGTPEWDRKPAVEAVAGCLKITCKHIIWGGNYYWLPPTNAWLIWDKMQKHSGSECEMAWSDLDQPVRKFPLSRVEAYCHREYKEHPNQKPLPLIEWCLSFLPPGLILDPFAGSCTVAVACARTGRKSVSIEIEEKYFRIGIERMEREAKRHPLLEQQPLQQRRLLT